MYDISEGLTGYSPGLLRTNPSNPNPYYTNHWRVIFSHIPNTEYFCQKVTFPSQSLNRVTLGTPMNPIHFEGDARDPLVFTMEFLMDEDFQAYRELHEWLNQEKPWEDSSDFNKNINKQHTASVIMHTNKDNANIEFRLYNCFPTTLGGLDLDSKSTDLSNFYVQADFSFDYFTIHSLRGS